MFATLDTAPKTRWIIDLDFDADPETPAETIRTDIVDQISAARGRVDLDGSRLVFEDATDALASRLRYGANLVRVVTSDI